MATKDQRAVWGVVVVHKSGHVQSYGGGWHKGQAQDFAKRQRENPDVKRAKVVGLPGRTKAAGY